VRTSRTTREGPGRDVLAALALVARGAVLGAALLARAGHVGGRATELALQGRRGGMTWSSSEERVTDALVVLRTIVVVFVR
jgi:hypothetical protein